MNWVGNNLDLIGQLTLVHLRQSLIALVVGFVISIPLGWVAWRYRLVRSGVITITGLLYTIPSLALLILVPVVTGWYSIVSETNLIVALAIYAVAILVRAVADGLDSVDAGVRQASTAIGYGSFRRFVAVEFPLAGPVVLAGLRVASASTIALATVGILVGIQNIGYLFTNGLQRRIIPEVFAGVVAVVVLALVIDLVLVLAGRLLMPWTRRVSAAPSRRRARTAVPA
ncbi:osmoprotectant transport system permease protein [Microbacterium hydrothermale]|uniref:ABC transporter permease n=1 Tax=Microbacterium hydrothermale TaxID=857427 RepID=UPI0010A90DA0|nr:ABC transporter permease [Microbacterium hydrothermale]MCW2165614.1 osmoprotectant transport system permease protein [Microbacterium hydrothermale]